MRVARVREYVADGHPGGTKALQHRDEAHDRVPATRAEHHGPDELGDGIFALVVDHRREREVVTEKELVFRGRTSLPRQPTLLGARPGEVNAPYADAQKGVTPGGSEPGGTTIRVWLCLSEQRVGISCAPT